MLVTCRDCGAGGGGGGLRSLLVLWEVFSLSLFLSMALEAFTLDRGALPFYEEHIQIDWKERGGSWHNGIGHLLQENSYLRLKFAWFIVRMNVAYGIKSDRKGKALYNYAFEPPPPCLLYFLLSRDRFNVLHNARPLDPLQCECVQIKYTV